jgi:hypothetical protein
MGFTLHGSDSFSEEILTSARDALFQNVEVKDRRYLLKNYRQCFRGDEAFVLLRKFIDEQLSGKDVDDEADAKAVAENLDKLALELGAALQTAGVFKHVTRDHAFKNEKKYYRFVCDELTHHGLQSEEGGWAAAAAAAGVAAAGEQASGTADGLHPRIRSRGVGAPSTPSSQSVTGDKNNGDGGGVSNSFNVSPLDEHNVRLLDCVHPLKWEPPTPVSGNDEEYHMVVIGAGAGGLVTAASCAGVGARVALIEQHLLGGDCLNVGCVPSKALLHSAALVTNTKRMSIDADGVEAGLVTVDFAAIM